MPYFICSLTASCHTNRYKRLILDSSNFYSRVAVVRSRSPSWYNLLLDWQSTDLRTPTATKTSFASKSAINSYGVCRNQKRVSRIPLPQVLFQLVALFENEWYRYDIGDGDERTPAELVLSSLGKDACSRVHGPILYTATRTVPNST